MPKKPARKSDTPVSTARRDQSKLNYRKSEETEARIFEATVDCLCAEGLRGVTLQKVADRAGVTRSGVQYYAASTTALLHAVQAYIVDKVWGDDLRRTRDLPHGPDRFAQALDHAIALPRSKYFIAWNELLTAARTDNALHDVVMNGARLREDIHDALFEEIHGDVQPNAVARLRSMDDLVVMALHAAAIVRFADDDGERIDHALALLKELTLDMFRKGAAV